MSEEALVVFLVSYCGDKKVSLDYPPKLLPSKIKQVENQDQAKHICVTHGSSLYPLTIGGTQLKSFGLANIINNLHVPVNGSIA